jgi:SAM-dependent methyltransferase
MTAVPPRPAGPLVDVYDAAYAGVPNRDIGRPRRAFLALAEAGYVEGPVFAVGCDTGELSLYLANRGLAVLGVDLSRRAVARARAKARRRGLDARFPVWDALALDRLADLAFAFRTVLDCAMFHVLGAAERDRFVDGLEAVLRAGGLYCVLGDARRDRGIYGLSPAELRARFDGPGRSVEFVHGTVFERRYSTNPAYIAGVRRTAAEGA